MRTSLPALTLLCLGSPAAALQDSPFTAHSVTVEGFATPYRLLAPAKVEQGKSYPLVLFLHGAGERGDDNEQQLVHFAGAMGEDPLRAKYECFVLAPQCPESDRWCEVDWAAEESTPFEDVPTKPMRGAIAALHEVLRAHPVDADRILLTGLSMGGYGAWDLATRHPEWFAAVAPVCGGGDESQATRMAGLPISVWHGGADGVVPPRRSRVMVEALKKVGADVAYHELEGVRHDSWTAAYAEDGLLDWFFTQRRAADTGLDAAVRLLAELVRDDERIVFLGDSITRLGVEPGGYVDHIRKGLAVRKPQAQVIGAGIDGHRVPDLLARYQADVIEKRATLVFVYVGINDVWHSESGKGTPIDEFEAGLDELVRGLLEAKATVVLATPSVIGEAPDSRLDEMLDDFAQCTRRVAAQHGLVVCDLRRAFVDVLAVRNASGAKQGVLTYDGVHLSSAGNTFVAIQAARALRQALVRTAGGRLPQARSARPDHGK